MLPVVVRAVAPWVSLGLGFLVSFQVGHPGSLEEVRQLADLPPRLDHVHVGGEEALHALLEVGVAVQKDVIRSLIRAFAPPADGRGALSCPMVLET